MLDTEWECRHGNCLFILGLGPTMSGRLDDRWCIDTSHHSLSLSYISFYNSSIDIIIRNMATITAVKGRQIIDSRGNPVSLLCHVYRLWEMLHVLITPPLLVTPLVTDRGSWYHHSRWKVYCFCPQWSFYWYLWGTSVTHHHYHHIDIAAASVPPRSVRGRSSWHVESLSS